LIVVTTTSNIYATSVTRTPSYRRKRQNAVGQSSRGYRR